MPPSECVEDDPRLGAGRNEGDGDDDGGRRRTAGTGGGGGGEEHYSGVRRRNPSAATRRGRETQHSTAQHKQHYTLHSPASFSVITFWLGHHQLPRVVRHARHSTRAKECEGFTRLHVSTWCLRGERATREGGALRQFASLPDRVNKKLLLPPPLRTIRSPSPNLISVPVSEVKCINVK